MQDNINAVLSPSEYSDKIQDEKEIKRWRRKKTKQANLTQSFVLFLL